MSFALVKDVSLVGWVDQGTKNIQSALSTRKLMAGVTFDFDVLKGYAETSIYAHNEKTTTESLARTSIPTLA